MRPSASDPRTHFVFAFLSLVVGVGYSTAPAIADDTAKFYSGKNLTVMIGSAPGGGYDTYGRVLARHLGRHVPGEPTVVVQNMQGAGSLKLINWLYNVAPKDGTVIGAFQSAAALEPLFGNKRARFDTTKFNWIGNMENSVPLCVAWHTAGIEKFEDVLSKETLFGGSGASSVISQQTAAIKNLLGAKIKIIEGYAGTTGISLAMQRGEVQAVCGVSLSTIRAQQADDVESGRLKIFLQMAREPSPELPGVPDIYDYAPTEEARQIMDIVFGRSRIGRPVAAPPGVPQARAAALQAGFMATMADPQLRKEAAKLKIDISPSSGEEVSKQFAQFFSYGQAVIEKTRAAMK